MTSTRDCAPAGFTLLEMIVIMVVVGLVLGLILARGPMHSRTVSTQTAASEMVEALRVARARAIATNRTVLFILDVAEHKFNVDRGQPRALPRELDLSVVTVAGGIGREHAAISFAPDGSSSGGRIDLIDRDLRLEIGIDWLTGRVSIADAH